MLRSTPRNSINSITVLLQSSGSLESCSETQSKTRLLWRERFSRSSTLSSRKSFSSLKLLTYFFSSWKSKSICLNWSSSSLTCLIKPSILTVSKVSRCSSRHFSKFTNHPWEVQDLSKDDHLSWVISRSISGCGRCHIGFFVEVSVISDSLCCWWLKLSLFWIRQNLGCDLWMRVLWRTHNDLENE